MINNKKKKLLLVLSTILLASPLAGCAGVFSDIGRAPDLSAVRTDLGSKSYSSGYNPLLSGYGAPDDSYNTGSLFTSNSNNFYRDPRAKKPGDILTVLISINDRASINNKTDLKRDSKEHFKGSASYSFLKNIAGSIDGETSDQSQGDGKIQRNEDIHLSVAAIITKVLPNGNLVIDGSQQVLVNYEMRQLNVAGIVRPGDIAGNNTISYDKIAEARIFYGGKGRASDLQRAPIGQQLMDKFSPI